MTISIIGAGSWGTALAVLLVEKNHEVTIWSYRQDQVINMKNTRQSDKLPGVLLPSQLNYTSDLAVACESELLVMAVPSKATRSTAEKLKPFIKPNQIIVSVTKGIEESTLMTQSEIIEDVLGADTKLCVLSGPSHAEEVVEGLPTVVVAGSKDKLTADTVQNTFMNENFRVYTSPDVVGIEVGAALKNVIALAAGMSDGLGFGDNAKAALITRGIKEITNLACAMGGRAETLAGLAGVGDLIVTCSSKHSRNRMCGFYIGQGVVVSEAIDRVGMIVEGVYSAKAALLLANKYKVEMPIIEHVNAVLFDGENVKHMVVELMTRDKKSELNSIDW